MERLIVINSRTARGRVLFGTSRIAIGVAALSLAAPALAQGAGGGQPVAQPQSQPGQPDMVVQQPNTVPVEQGSTTSDKPQPDQANEQIADPVTEATNV